MEAEYFKSIKMNECREKEMAALKSEVQELMKSLELREDELSQVKGAFESAESEIKKARGITEESMNVEISFKEQVDGIARDLAETSGERDSLGVRLAALEAGKNELVAELALAKELVLAANSKYEAAMIEKEELDSQISQLGVDSLNSESRFDAVNSKLQASLIQLSELSTKIDEANTSYGSLVEDNARARDEIVQTSSREIEMRDKSISALSQEKANLTERVSSLEARMIEDESVLDTLKSQFSLETDNLSAQLSAAKISIEQHLKSIACLTDDVERESAGSKRLAVELEEVKVRRDESDAMLEESKLQLDNSTAAYSVKLEAAYASFKEFEDKISLVESESKKLVSQISVLEEEKVELSEKIVSVSQAADETKARFEETIEELETVEGELIQDNDCLQTKISSLQVSISLLCPD